MSWRLLPLMMAALAATLGVSCSPRPRTQVMLVVQAQQGVRDRATRLEVTFRSGNEELGPTEMWPVAVTRDAWPRKLAVVPRRGVTGQRFEFVASAYERDQRIGTVRAISGFVEGRTGELVLVIEDCCESVHRTCTEEQTCRNCACTSAVVPPQDIPLLDENDAALRDAPATDAFTPVPPDAFTADAFTPDAFTRPDAFAPIVAEGTPCDAADVLNHCIAGTVCTCDHPQGCVAAAPPPRCYPLSTINCTRPIDVTARWEVAGGTFSVAFDATTTTAEIIAGSCPNPGQDLVYVLRNTRPLSTNIALESGTTFDFWFDCVPGRHTWNASACSISRVQSGFTPGNVMYIFVQGSGVHALSIRSY